MIRHKSVYAAGTGEIVEKKSRFIAHVQSVSSVEEAQDYIEGIRKKYWDARHNCYAFSVGVENPVTRFSDDGEPHSTAGMPTLDVILKNGVEDVVVVVTRYFGGILLGTGGLVRAYSKAAKLALEAGEIVNMKGCRKFRIVCDYNLYGKLSGLIPESGGITDDTDFGAEVTISFHMPPECVPGFEKRLADVSCGSVSAEETGEGIYPV